MLLSYFALWKRILILFTMLLILGLADKLSYFSPSPEDFTGLHGQHTPSIRWSYLSFAKILSSVFPE